MKGKYENYLLFGVLILLLAGLIFAVTGFTEKEITTNTIDKTASKPLDNLNDKDNSNDKSGYQTVSTGTTGPGDVSMELTPQEINNGQLQVEIAVNTHSVDLNQFDLKEITTLEFDDKLIKPALAPALSGHHDSGTLVFEVDDELNSFIIKIRGIPKVEERVFEWR